MPALSGEIDMEEKKRKKIGAIVIVACLAVVGIMTFMKLSEKGGGINSLEGRTTWVKCAKCNSSHEMSQTEYYEYIREHAGPIPIYAPPLPCDECGEESVYIAVKCEKCGEVFYEISDGSKDFTDRCPECDYSKIEDSR
jgi:hypothetical protein